MIYLADIVTNLLWKKIIENGHNTCKINSFLTLLDKKIYSIEK